MATCITHMSLSRTQDRRQQKDAREQRAVRRDRLIEFFHLAVNLQHEYKKIRRTLRAASFLDQGNLVIERGVFEQLMDRLEDCQLRAESLYRQVVVERELFGLKKRRRNSNKNLKGNPKDISTDNAKEARKVDTEEGDPSPDTEDGQDDNVDDNSIGETTDDQDQIEGTLADKSNNRALADMVAYLRTFF